MDFHKTIEKYFAAWGWGTLLSTLSIIIVSIALLDLKVATPMQKIELNQALSDGQDNQGDIVRWLPRNDPRSFSTVYKPNNSPATGIGWISASSVSVRKAPKEWRFEGRSGYELSEVLAKTITSLNDKPVQVHRYLLQGARSTDIRRAVLDAVNDPNIDMLMVSISPLYVANDYLAFTKSYQRGSGFRYGKSEGVDVRVAASAMSPLEILLEKRQHYVSVFRYKELYSKKLGTHDLKGFLVSGGGSSDGAGLKYWQNWLFPKGYFGSIDKKVKPIAGYRRIILMQSMDESNIGRKLFQANVRAAAESSKPVLFYFPPLNSLAQEDPALVEFIDQMVASLKKDIDTYGGPNVKFDSSMIYGASQPNAHLDIIHLSHGQGVINDLITIMEREFKVDIRTDRVSNVYDRHEYE